MTSLILSVRTIPFMRSFIEFVSSIRSSITLIHIFNLIKEDSWFEGLSLISRWGLRVNIDRNLFLFKTLTSAPLMILLIREREVSTFFFGTFIPFILQPCRPILKFSMTLCYDLITLITYSSIIFIIIFDLLFFPFLQFLSIELCQ